ncbi:LPXTG cell wall anchor domain-containing protein [Enterococcus raffinosus]|uniref:LPXTG cell wall anchor domain-containing protein n=1 Tax=Enterococcus raffinosus TaxID=71452 RepID=UPI003ACB2D33
MTINKCFKLVSLVLLLGIGSFLLPSVEGTAASSEQPTIVAYESEKEVASAEHPLEPKQDYLYKEPMQATEVGDTLPQTGAVISQKFLLIGFLLLLIFFFLESIRSKKRSV